MEKIPLWRSANGLHPSTEANIFSSEHLLWTNDGSSSAYFSPSRFRFSPRLAPDDWSIRIFTSFLTRSGSRASRCEKEHSLHTWRLWGARRQGRRAMAAVRVKPKSYHTRFYIPNLWKFCKYSGKLTVSSYIERTVALKLFFQRY